MPLHSSIDPSSSDFARNADAMRALVADLREKLSQVAGGGGEASRNRHTSRGKMLAREPEAQLRAFFPGQKPMLKCAREWKVPLLAFTGVDLAFSQKTTADDTALFTFCPLPTGHRLILDIEVGKWNAPTVAKKIAEKHRRFNSIVTVESNAAQKGIIELLGKVRATQGIPTGLFQTMQWSQLEALSGNPPDLALRRQFDGPGAAPAGMRPRWLPGVPV